MSEPSELPVIALHREVDAAAAPLQRQHRERLQCRRGCHDCCVDGLTVFEVEAERIRAAHPRLLAEGRPHPPGACAFLDGEGACRIYDARPYVCRTQGLPLRWLDRDPSGATVEYRDICPLNELESAPLEALDADACWELGPFESRLAQLQRSTEATGPVGSPYQAPARVALRELFGRC